jgi:LysM repeat protein
MGIFGKSFEEKVNELRATVEGKIVTLEGQADSMETKGRIMTEFNKLVATENTVNRIRVQAAPAATSIPPLTPQKTEEESFYVVQKGDTLSALAQRCYGKASLYMKIFEANRDILSDPNLIKIGQKLKIPK